MEANKTEETKNKNIIKAGVVYEDLASLMARETIIIDTIKNAINRENSDKDKDFKLVFLEKNISVREDGRYGLEVLIKKEYK